MGSHFEALDEGVLLAPLDSRYTQVGFNLFSVQVCHNIVVEAASIKMVKCINGGSSIEG